MELVHEPYRFPNPMVHHPKPSLINPSSFDHGDVYDCSDHQIKSDQDDWNSISFFFFSAFLATSVCMHGSSVNQITPQDAT